MAKLFVLYALISTGQVAVENRIVDSMDQCIKHGNALSVPNTRYTVKYLCVDTGMIDA